MLGALITMRWDKSIYRKTNPYTETVNRGYWKLAKEVF